MAKDYCSQIYHYILWLDERYTGTENQPVDANKRRNLQATGPGGPKCTKQRRPTKSASEVSNRRPKILVAAFLKNAQARSISAKRWPYARDTTTSLASSVKSWVRGPVMRQSKQPGRGWKGEPNCRVNARSCIHR